MSAPRTPLGPLLLLVAGLSALPACDDGCDLASTLPGFTPVCDDAVLARYPDETRLVVLSAEGGALVAYLPAGVEELPYGGTTGRPLSVLIETDQGDIVAGVPESSLVIRELGPDAALVDLTVDIDQGWVHGRVQTAVEFRD